jgi:dynein intermediate chain
MNQAAPEYVFTAQSPVLTGMFHPFSPNLLLGATYSGQICLWDIRARRSPIQKTQLSMKVVGPQNAHNLVTISTNGKLCQWDTTQLVMPTETLSLKMEPTGAGKGKGSDSEVAVTCCGFAHGETNTFCIGSETGTVYNVEMHGSQPGVQEAHSAHHALVSSMQFHPQTDVRGSASDVLLTSSFDWTLKLWNFKRSRDKPLHTFSNSSDYIFDAKWSPIHPSVLVSGDGSGNMDFWDLCKDMEVPIHRVKNKSSSAVSTLAWHASGEHIASGHSDGRISKFDVNPGVAKPDANAHSSFVELLSSLPLANYAEDGNGGDVFD